MAVYSISVLSCIIVVLSEKRNPIKSLAWIVALIFLPVLGLILYLFFGRSLRAVRLISKRSRRKLLSRQRPSTMQVQRQLSPVNQRLATLTTQLTGHPLVTATKIDIFTDGPSKFQALERDILAAKESINLQYYIFSDDKLGHRIANLLMQKAREGVKVRVMYDHVGSFSVRTASSSICAGPGSMPTPSSA